MRNYFKPIFLATFIFVISGCSSLVAVMTGGLADQLGRATKASDDPQLVESALPAYMLMLDGLLLDDPDDPDLLLSSANLYTAYASIFVDDSNRQKKLALKGYQLAYRASCIENELFCNLDSVPFIDFENKIKAIDEDDIGLIFSLARSWAGYIQAASDDWKVVANLAKVQKLLERVIAVDEKWEHGEAQYYLGIIKSLVPPALGGKPQQALYHFEKAKTFSNEQNLTVDVAIAERYARAIFDRKLHDRILNKVLTSHPDNNQYRLTNTLAKIKAKILLINANEFF